MACEYHCPVTMVSWIGLLGAGTLAGLFVGTSLFGYISDKVGRRKMFLIDIIAIGVISVATMFVSSPVELLVMRVLIQKAGWNYEPSFC